MRPRAALAALTAAASEVSSERWLKPHCFDGRGLTQCSAFAAKAAVDGSLFGEKLRAFLGQAHSLHHQWTSVESDHGCVFNASTQPPGAIQTITDQTRKQQKPREARRRQPAQTQYTQHSNTKTIMHTMNGHSRQLPSTY